MLVASAGITGPNTTLWEYPVDEWRQVIDVNLNGLFHCNRAVVPHMLDGRLRPDRQRRLGRRQGGQPERLRLQHVEGGGDRADQVAGQGARQEEHHRQRRHPGGGATAIFDQMTQEHIDFMLSKIPMGRFGKVEEITSLICWIASEECSFTTGSVFDASGGRATY